MTFQEKYAPKTLADIVFADENTKTIVGQFARGERSGNIILHGPRGTAKSTTAKIILKTRDKNDDDDYSHYTYHASTITNKDFTKFVNEWHWQGFQDTMPCTIIEEVDQLSLPHQNLLRTTMDKYKKGSFILTTNKIHLLDEPLVDRCYDIEMPMANSDAWFDTAAKILQAEGIKYDDEQVSKILALSNGSIRDILRNIEDFVLCKK